MPRLLLTFAVAAILAASPARAQDIRPPRVEIGASLSGIVPIVFEDGPAILVAGGPRLTLNATRRIGIELSSEVLGPVEFSGTMALYQTQLKFPMTRSREGTRTLSLTVGAVGLASYRRVQEWRRLRLDGSTVVVPGHRRFQATAPSTVSIGVAREEVFGRYASMSLGVQGYMGAVGGFAVRASAGLSFGRYR
jgi:hypothetical protein